MADLFAKEPRRRARDLGIPLGRYRPGRQNAITDVKGVAVGHSTIVRGTGELKSGVGPVRTGVTAILPGADVFGNRVTGGGFVLNGAGEVSGLTQVMEWGLIETPIFLTNTLSVGQVTDSAVKYMIDHFPGIGSVHDVIIPVVGECDDSWLNDIGGRHVHEEHVLEALRTASEGPVLEGSVGGGTGMITCDFKAGIGTSSRKLPEVLGGYTLGVLVMSNFGLMHNLRISGLPVGELLADRFNGVDRRKDNYGSIIAVVATDAPLQNHQLNRLAKRVALGIGRVGSFAAHGSGEIVVCFSTANRIPRETQKMVYRIRVLLDQRLDPLYEAVIECTEEAILNSMFMSESMEGINSHLVPALPLSIVREYVQKSNLALHPQPPRPAQKPPAEPPSSLTAAAVRPTDGRSSESLSPPEPSPEPQVPPEPETKK